MPAIVKNNKVSKAKKPAKKRSAKYSELPDLSNDPYFVKKAESARATLAKSGIILKD
jgi:hypothetical protein